MVVATSPVSSADHAVQGDSAEVEAPVAEAKSWSLGLLWVAAGLVGVVALGLGSGKFWEVIFLAFIASQLFSGLHLLFSHVWLVSFLILRNTELEFVRACFISCGYAGVLIGWYAIFFRTISLQMFPSSRVVYGWGRWIILNVCGKTEDVVEEFCRKFEKGFTRYVFAVVFHCFDFVFHLLPCMWSLQEGATLLTPASCFVGSFIILIWFKAVRTHHYEVSWKDSFSLKKLVVLAAPPPLDGIDNFDRLCCLPRIRSVYPADPPIAKVEVATGIVLNCLISVVLAVLAGTSRHWVISEYLGLGFLLDCAALWNLVVILGALALTSSVVCGISVFSSELGKGSASKEE